MFKFIKKFFNARAELKRIQDRNEYLEGRLQELWNENIKLRQAVATLMNLDDWRNGVNYYLDNDRIKEGVKTITSLLNDNKSLAWSNVEALAEIKKLTVQLDESLQSSQTYKELWQKSKADAERLTSRWETEYTALAAKNLTLQAKIAELEAGGPIQ
jgi:DNA repair exonuclease SbcCD ATPase subunit